MVNTLPLFQNPPIADAWHNVTAPGGYEWWYFDAEDVECDRRIVAALCDGFAFHPEYLRRYNAYARDPTRVAPPRSSQYICAHFAVYHVGKVEHQFLAQYPAEQFEARRDTRHVTIGPNRFSAGTTPQLLELFMAGRSSSQTALSARLEFAPRFDHTPNELELCPRSFTGATHRWIIANALCDVNGEIHVADSTMIPFRGRGYHDHHYGTRPIGSDIKQWFGGRLLLDDRCITFHLTCPQVQLIEIDSTGAQELEIEIAQVELDWSQKSAGWLRYPLQARFGDVLMLANPQVMDSSPFDLRILYDATLRGTKVARALCGVVYPQRLRMPILGRVIERRIDRRAMFDSSR